MTELKRNVAEHIDDQQKTSETQNDRHQNHARDLSHCIQDEHWVNKPDKGLSKGHPNNYEAEYGEESDDGRGGRVENK